MSDYHTWVWEVMGKDRHALQCKRLYEQRNALASCNSEYEREQCKAAYSMLMAMEVDALQQSRGFPATAFYMPKLASNI